MRHLIFDGSLLLLLLSHPAPATPGPLAPARYLPAQGKYGFNGTIVNANTQRTIISDVVIYDSTGQTQLGKLQTDRNGAFITTAETTGPYRFAVSALGYVPQEVTLTATAGAPTAFTVRLVPLDVGVKVTLHNIRFTKSKADLLPESFDELSRLADRLKNNDRMEIQLNGHTDNQGDPAQNLLLSENRVKAVERYLVRQGVPAARLHGQGFGGAQPIASNQQEHTRKLNRRVEFEILKN